MILTVVAFACTSIASVLVLITVLREDFSFEFRVILSIVALIVALLTVGVPVNIYETERQLKRFEEYKAEIKQRWGPLDNS